MRIQAVRRSPRYLRARQLWRRLDPATRADATLGALLLIAWAVMSLVLPLLVRA